MGRRRTGSVYEKDGVLWYSFLLRSGKKYTKRVPPLPDGRVATKEQARTYKDEAIRRYELGLWDPEAPNPHAPHEPAAAAPVPTVAEFGERWIKGLAHASKFNEELFVRRHVRDTDLGRMKITEVTPPHVLTWVKALRAAPSTMGGVLAPLTVRTHWGMLKRLFVSAVFERVIPSTPCVLPPGSLPKGTDKVPGARKHWRHKREEVEQLISDVRIPQGRRVLWAVLLCGGLRAGEAFALRWRDYDPARQPLGCLSVDRAWSSRHKLEKETKTKAAREVPVHPTLAAILGEWKLSGWQAQYGRLPTPDDLIVPNTKCETREVTSVVQSLHADCKRLGLPRRRLHGMRHTFISLAIDDGARADIIEKITHTKPVTTAFEAYRAEAWPTLCAEVAKLKVQRIPDELPLWKVASGGGGSAMDSTTNSATGDAGTVRNSGPSDTCDNTLSPSGSKGVSRVAAETKGFSQVMVGVGGANPTQSALSDTDSATSSATGDPTCGPLTGELWAQRWFEQSLLAEANDRGEIPDIEDIEP